MTDLNEPLIPAEQSLPEITLKAIIISIILTILLTASNAYLALKVGTTVAASIPAAVMAMGILRFFKNHNVLEINIIQTSASAGESVVAAIAYTTPALVMMHFWLKFNYWEIVLLAILGGSMGVLFSVPLRRVLLADKTLHFPEGTAIGNVLRAGATGKNSLKLLVMGGLVGGALTFIQTGLQVIADHWDLWWGKASTTIYGFGVGFSPALIAAGFIVGVRVAVALLFGIAVCWLIGVPVLTHIVHVPAQLSAADGAVWIWMHEIRYIGVGTMLIGGLWLLLTLIKPIGIGIAKSFASVKQVKTQGKESILRTERDIPITKAIWLTVALMVPIFIYLFNFIQPELLQLSLIMHIVIALVLLVFTVLMGFLISSICGYFAGLIGSTNSPLSGMILIVLILGSFLLMLLMVTHHLSPKQLFHLSAMAIMLAVIVGVAGALSVDTMQDLKAGHMVGATPWKQQVMLLIGVVVSALVAPVILNLLFNAYGIGDVLPHPGMPAAQALSAPQGQLLQSVVMGVFGGNLNWPMVYVGMIFAAICIVIDEFLKPRGFRLAVLAVGVGIYLPIEVTMPMIFGGLLSGYLDGKYKIWTKKGQKEKAYDASQRTIMLACGLVAGSTLMGVFLAIPFVIYQSSDALAIMPASLQWLSEILGGATLVFLLGWLYRSAMKSD